MANKISGFMELPELSANPSTPSSGVQRLFPKTDNKLYVGNSLGQVNELRNPIVFTNSLSSDFPAIAQVNLTRVDVTGWQFNVTAGKSYKITVLGLYKTIITTTGGSMGVVLTSGVGTIAGYIEGAVSSVTASTGLQAPLYAINATNTTAGSFMTTTGTSSTAPHSIVLDCVLNCTTTGVFSVQWGTEVVSSLAQLVAGSNLYVVQLN